MLIDNYNNIRQQIDEACKNCGRDPKEVTLIAVSKTKPLSDIEELAAHGVMEFGENYPQELASKYNEISTPVHFHQIGHLQTNKIKYIIDKVTLIHSVDSLHLVEAINKEASKRGIVSDILIEVNFAAEDSKFGLMPQDTEQLVRDISCLHNVKIRGLMTIAPFVENPEDNRPVFKGMRQLLLDIKSKNIDNVDMCLLSMGMTNDYKVAVEEGATHVRVGTAIFGARDYSNR